ncbi:MAG TPA: CPBP family intramembrane metalloprotease [Ignavibacteriales bacterium]|nr:CPBP family intramembrane metalloprotease [Ignavibacteriales bacterium]
MNYEQIVSTLTNFERGKIGKYKHVILLVFFSITSLYLFFFKNNIPISTNLTIDLFLGLFSGLVLYYLMIFISKAIKLLYQTNSISKAFDFNKNTIINILFIISYVFLEELLFRSMLYSYLLEEISIWSAIIITSFAYSFLHFNFNKFIQLFIMGILLSLLVYLTNGLLASILTHTVNNLLVFRFITTKK